MKYTKEYLEPIAKESNSMSEVVRKIGKRTDNGFVTYLSKLFKKFDIDKSHFKTKSQLIKEKVFSYPIESYLSNEREIKSDTLKKRLISLGMKKKICEECGILDWNGKYLSFELHHIDGNHYNNNLDNLRMLCPNCHYTTHNLQREQKKEKQKINKKIIKGNVRVANLKPNLRKVDRPEYQTLIDMTKEIGFCATSRKFGVTDNTIRKWIKMYEKYSEDQIA